MQKLPSIFKLQSYQVTLARVLAISIVSMAFMVTGLGQAKGNSSLSSGGSPAAPPKSAAPNKPKSAPAKVTPIAKAPVRPKEEKPVRKPDRPEPRPAPPRPPSLRTTDDISGLVVDTPEARGLVSAANALVGLKTPEGFLQAAEKYGQASVIYHDINNKKGQALTSFNAATSYANGGDNTTAIEWYNKALPLYQTLKQRRDEADSLSGLAKAHCLSDLKDKCAEYYQSAATIYLEQKQNVPALESLRSAANAYFSLSRYVEARTLFMQAAGLVKDSNDVKSQIDLFAWVARTYEGEKNYPEAGANYQAGLDLARTNAPGLIVEFLNNIGLTYKRSGNFEKALATHQEALQEAQTQNSKSGISVSQSYLDQTQREIDKIKQTAPATPPNQP